MASRYAGPGCLKKDGAHRYSGFRDNRTSRSGAYESQRKGPVPTGRVPKSFPALRTASGETGASTDWATELRNGAKGRLNFTRTVWRSMTVLLSYGPMPEKAICDFSSGSTMRSKVNLTASAVNGVPS
jgi:hypothetical protein